MGQPLKLSPIQAELLCARYLAGENPFAIAADMGVQYHTLRGYLRRAGITQRYLANWTLKPEQISIAIQMYENGIPSTEIAHAINSNPPTVLKTLRKHGVRIKTMHEAKLVYACDDRYFKRIDTENKAYWLGFVAADGCISEDRSSLTIILSKKDSDHLSRFKTAIRSNHPLTFSVSEGKPTVRVILTSPKLVTDLINHGITPRKTFTIQWPELRFCLQSHFLRGYFDGDGCFQTPKSSYVRQDGHRSAQLAFGLVGSCSLIPVARKLLIQECELSPVKIQRANRKDRKQEVVKFVYKGNRQLVRIANFMYEDATTFLPRKRDIVLKHYQNLPKYRDQLRFG